jgi:transposase
MVARRWSVSTDLSPVAGPLCIGVDVSKDWLDIADNAGRALRIADTVAAITEALAGPWSQGCRAMVCEATGGYERPLMRVAAQLGLPLRRVHPNRARAFAQVTARLGLRPMRSMLECWLVSPPSSPMSRPGLRQPRTPKRSPPWSAGSTN